MGAPVKGILGREGEKRSGVAAVALFNRVDYFFVNLKFSNYGELTQRLAFGSG